MLQLIELNNLFLSDIELLQLISNISNTFIKIDDKSRFDENGNKYNHRLYLLYKNGNSDTFLNTSIDNIIINKLHSIDEIVFTISGSDNNDHITLHLNTSELPNKSSITISANDGDKLFAYYTQLIKIKNNLKKSLTFVRKYRIGLVYVLALLIYTPLFFFNTNLFTKYIWFRNDFTYDSLSLPLQTLDIVSGISVLFALLLSYIYLSWINNLIKPIQIYDSNKSNWMKFKKKLILISFILLLIMFTAFTLKLPTYTWV